MTATGTYAYRDGKFVKISDRVPKKGTPAAATRTFMENAMYGYRRCEERGQRFLGKKDGIERIWKRAASLTQT